MAEDGNNPLETSIPKVDEPSAPTAIVRTKADSPLELDTEGRTLEVAHVLFMDIVAYSCMSTDSQTQTVELLQELVRSTPEFLRASAAQRLISLPTGDGMALAFFHDPRSPVQCALELARSLQQRPQLQLRMGVHSGPVYRVADINANWNIAGGGINIAQRVMDCGDAGHILVSQTVADTLSQVSGWEDNLADLGVQQVKHGVKVHIFNVCVGTLGNRNVPSKLRASHKRQANRRLVAAVSIIAVLAIATFLGYRWWTTRSGLDSLAILPIVNVSGDPNIDYLSEGMTDGLIDTLGKLPNLMVVSRSAVVRYARQRNVDPEVVGRTLSVKAVLTGTVVRNADHLVVTAELVDARSRRHLWGQKYEGSLNGFSAIQEEIANDVAGGLKLALSSEDRKRLRKRFTDNPDAEQAYLYGRFFWNKRTHQDLDKAIEYFKQAIKKDPNYALAYTGLADAYSMQSGSISPKQIFPQAENAAMKAVYEDDELAEAHAALAFIKFHYDWDWLEADKEYRRALALNPNYASGHSNYAVYLLAMGRFDEALAQANRAKEIEPTSLPINLGVARVLYVSGKYDDAIGDYQKVLELFPSAANAHIGMALALEQQSKYPEAFAEYAQVPGASENYNIVNSMAHLYAHAGQKRKALELLQKMSEIAKNRYTSACDPTVVYAVLGDKDKAFEDLEKCYEERSWDMAFLKVEPNYQGLRQDDRYVDLLKRLKL